MNKVPKNYTLFYKYFGSRFKDVQYFEIDVNVSLNSDPKPVLKLLNSMFFWFDCKTICANAVESNRIYLIENLFEEHNFSNMQKGLVKGFKVCKDYMFQVPSTGRVNVYSEEQVDATIHINFAYNVTATISIYGSLPGTDQCYSLKKKYFYEFLNELASIPRYRGFPSSDYTQKSLTFVDVRNANKSLKKTYRNSIGTRRKNDQLLFFESKNVRNISRFPSRSFSYSADAYINYVGFSFDVSLNCNQNLRF